MRPRAYILGTDAYLDGTDILGENIIPSVGENYNDSATVRAVQTALKAKGFNPGTIDGVFGPNTAKAIKAMQASVGVPVTGVVDYGVISALKIDRGAALAEGAAGIASSGGGGSSPFAPMAASASSALPGGVPTWKYVVGAGAGALVVGGLIVLAARK